MKKAFTQKYYSYGSDIIFNSLSKGVAAKLCAFAATALVEAEKEAEYTRYQPVHFYKGRTKIINGIEYSLEFVSINYNWKCTSLYFWDWTRSRLVRISDHWCHKVGAKTVARGRGRTGVADLTTATKMVNSHWELSGDDQSFEVFHDFGRWEAGQLPNGVYRPATNGKVFEGGWVSWQDIQLSPSLKGLKPSIYVSKYFGQCHTSDKPFRGKHPSKINSEYKKTHRGKLS